jgi:hypothetical protein
VSVLRFVSVCVCILLYTLTFVVVVLALAVSRETVDRYLENESGQRNKAGLAPSAAMPHFTPPPATSATAPLAPCSICFDEFAPSQMLALWCGHAFCLGCWRDYLSSAVLEPEKAVFKTCMTPKCPAAVTSAVVSLLFEGVSKAGAVASASASAAASGTDSKAGLSVPVLSARAITGDSTVTDASGGVSGADVPSKYRDALCKHFVSACTHSYRYCPNPRCDSVLAARDGAAVDPEQIWSGVKCGMCRTAFCALCEHSNHVPATCQNMKDWTARGGYIETSDEIKNTRSARLHSSLFVVIVLIVVLLCFCVQSFDCSDHQTLPALHAPDRKEWRRMCSPTPLPTPFLLLSSL